MLSDADRTLSEALWGNDVPTKEVRCRHCSRKNRVSIPDAVFAARECACGACDQPLFLSASDPLERIASRSYEHPLDRRSLDTLKSLPGFPALTNWLLKSLGERATHYLFTASHLLCGEQQFPELVAMMESARRRLDMQVRPRLYLGESPYMNAGTTGVDDPVIVVDSALLDQLDDKEVTTVLGHELGHLHSNHVLYHAVAELFLVGGDSIGGLASLVTSPLRLAVLKWYRCSELTADRAGLLATGDLRAALTIMMKFASGARPGTTRRTTLDLGAFVRQARALSELESSSWLDGAVGFLWTMKATHPFATFRALELVRWIEKGNYLDIQAGHFHRTSSS